jgi:hypothetical protein
MDILGIAKFGLEILGKLFSWRRNRKNPIRQQAQRVLEAFEAHGILKQQIPRLLPSDFSIPMDSFSSPDRLKTKLSPAFLDWVAITLNLQRGWLDGGEELPHEHYDIYQDLAAVYHWLQERQAAINHQTMIFHVLAVHPGKNPCEGKGRFCVVLEERFAEMDKRALSRYYTLTHGWTFEHISCLIELTCLAALSEALSIRFLGRVVSKINLDGVEKGKKFIPEVLNQSTQRWEAINLVPVRYKTEGLSEFHRNIWDAALEHLQNAKLKEHLLVMD